MDGHPAGPGTWRRVRTRPRVWGAAALAAVVAVVVLVWFQPQSLLYDTTVDEGLPGAAPAGDSPTPEPADTAGDGDSGSAEGPEDQTEPEEPTGPEARLTGAFSSGNRYTVAGTATVYEREDGSRVLRLEDFSSTNGPDLYVYLVAGDPADDDDDRVADAVDLGGLKGNVGNQNYGVPDGIDLDRYDTVLIWCERFTVGFGAAELGPAELEPSEG